MHAYIDPFILDRIPIYLCHTSAFQTYVTLLRAIFNLLHVILGKKMFSVTDALQYIQWLVGIVKLETFFYHSFIPVQLPLAYVNQFGVLVADAYCHIRVNRMGCIVFC